MTETEEILRKRNIFWVDPDILRDGSEIPLPEGVRVVERELLEPPIEIGSHLVSRPMWRYTIEGPRVPEGKLEAVILQTRWFKDGAEVGPWDDGEQRVTFEGWWPAR